MRIRKKIQLVAVVVAALSLAACTGVSSQPPASTKGPYGTLNVGMAVLGPYGCDPATTTSATTSRALETSGAYETLVQLDKNGKYQPLLAKSWTTSSDGTTWTFHLQQGVKFSMGYGEMTSDDVVYSLERAIAPGSLNGNVGSLKRLFQKVTAVDKYTVEINTGKPQSDLLAFLRNDIAGAAYIVSHKQAEKVGEANLASVGCAGTGPWQFVAAKTGQYWEFKAVKNHWRHTPAFETLYLRDIPEEATRVAEFQSGQLDTALLSPDSLAVAKQVPGAKIMTPGVGIDMHLGFYGNYYVKDWPGYDPSLPWVSSSPDTNSAAWKRAVEVRQAMSIAIDRKSLVKNLLGGSGEVTALWGWDSAASPLPSGIKWDYSPTEAKKLLAEAGYPNGFKVTLNVRLAGSPAEVQVCQAVATMWSNIGLDVTFQNQPNDAILPSLVNRSYNGIVCQAVGDQPEPINQYVNWALSTAGFSGGIEHPELDTLINEATATIDPAKRLTIEQKIATFTFDNALDAGLYRAFVQWPVGPKINDWSKNYAYGDGRILASLEYVTHRTS